MSFQINRIVTIPRPKFRMSIDLELIKLIETITPFPKVAWLDYEELKPKDNKLRFLIKTAYNERDRTSLKKGRKWNQRSIEQVEDIFLRRDFEERHEPSS